MEGVRNYFHGYSADAQQRLNRLMDEVGKVLEAKPIISSSRRTFWLAAAAVCGFSFLTGVNVGRFIAKQTNRDFQVRSMHNAYVEGYIEGYGDAREGRPAAPAPLPP